MTDEDPAEVWNAAEHEYAQRQAFRRATLLDGILDAHAWPGGYFCKCGRALTGPDGYARHIIAEWWDAENAQIP